MQFASCDWGTTAFRLRLSGFETAREFRSDDGTAKLAAVHGDRASKFREVLAHGLGQLSAPAGLPVMISGMAGSSIGWQELPYAALPFGLHGENAVWREVDDKVFILSGVRGEHEIMRGEETEAMGLFAAHGTALPGKAVLILPGTHSKHLLIESGSLVDFRTYMTGELFDVLARQSVLRHSTELAAPFDRGAFLDGVGESRILPLSSALFRVRTRQVLHGRNAASNTAFLSGLLIGAECSDLRVRNVPVLVAAGDRMRQAYTLAAEALGVPAGFQSFDSETLSMHGQGVVLKRIFEAR